MTELEGGVSQAIQRIDEVRVELKRFLELLQRALVVPGLHQFDRLVVDLLRLRDLLPCLLHVLQSRRRFLLVTQVVVRLPPHP